MDNKAKGKRAEDLASKLLINEGYEIIETNYRHRKSEIDIIALKDNQLLVFIEVKFRSTDRFGEAVESVSDRQKANILSGAEEYIFAIDWKKDIRFDIITVSGKGTIDWYKDAFY